MLTREERIALAVEILGAGAKTDIREALDKIEEEVERHDRPDPYPHWREDFGDFVRDLKAVQRHIERMCHNPNMEEPELIRPLGQEVATWIARLKRQLDHPGIKHQRQTRRHDDVDKIEAALQAMLLLARHGKPTRRLHNKLAAILHGDESADLRRHCRGPFIHTAVGNPISPYNFRRGQLAQAIPQLTGVAAKAGAVVKTAKDVVSAIFSALKPSR